MKLSFKYIFQLIILIVVLEGCGKRIKVPAEFPDEDSMAVILADIYYTEAILNQSREFIRGQEDDLPKYYKFTLQRHGIGKKEFDTIFSWYSNNPKLLSEVYDKVISILNENETRLRYDTTDMEEFKEPIGISGMTNLWKGKRTFSVNIKDTTNNCLPFTIEVDSLQSGIYRLMATYRFAKGNLLDKAHLKLIACYSDSTADTVSYSIDKSFSERITTLSLDADKHKYVIGLEGLLLEHDTTVDAMCFIKNVKLLHIPRHGSNYKPTREFEPGSLTKPKSGFKPSHNPMPIKPPSGSGPGAL
jgi:predicted small lipoprotein YifL